MEFRSLPFEYQLRYADHHAKWGLDLDVAADMDDRDRQLEDFLATSGGGHPFIVAASDASAKLKVTAHYVCDGSDDDEEIQAAIDDCGPAGGGVVLLVGGSFTLGATVAISTPVRLMGASIRGPHVYTSFNGTAFDITTAGVHVEALLIDTAGYFGGSANVGAAIGASASPGVNPSWLTVRSVETITASAAGIYIDGESAPTGSQPGDYMIDNCVFFTTNAADAIYVRNARHVYWTNCAMFGAGASGEPSMAIVKGATGNQGQAHNMIWLGGSLYGNVSIAGTEMKVLGAKVSGISGPATVTLESDSESCFVVACVLDAPVVDNGTDNTTALNVPESVTGDGFPAPGTSVVAETAYAQASTAGVASTFSRSDHSHGTPALPTPAQIGAAEDGHTHSGGEQIVADGQAAVTALTNEAEDDWLFQG